MNKDQTDLFMKIVVVILFLWLIKDLMSITTCKNKPTKSIKSNFFIPQIDRDLMKKNTIYVYVRNPFLDDQYKNIDIETLRNADDLTDRTKFSYIMTTYYNLQNQHFHINDDITNVVKQLRNLYKINDIEFHTSASSVIDFSDNEAYTQILDELSSTEVANTKSTFTSTYDANIVTRVVSVNPVNVKVDMSGIKVTGQKIQNGSKGRIDFLYDPNVKADMLIVNKGNLLQATDKSFFRILSVTRNKSSSQSSSDTMTLEIENLSGATVTFDALGFYDILQRNGAPIPKLTKYLYDQTIRDDEIVVVFNNKMVSFNTESFDPNIYSIRYSKNKTLDFEIPPYQNFRRQQLMQLLYKNHF